MAGLNRKGIYLENLTSVPSAPIDGLHVYSNASGNLSTIDENGNVTTFTPLATTAAISAALLAQILNTSGADDATFDNGTITCNTFDKTYSVTHATITNATPIITLEIPDDDSTLYAVSVHTQTASGFQITLSDIPAVEGYKLHWAAINNSTSIGGIGSGSTGDVSEATVIPTYGHVSRTLSDMIGHELNVKSFGAIGDNASHPLSSAEANLYNTLYGSYGLNVSAGDENDYAAIQAAVYVASKTGRGVYVPVGTYRIGTKSISVEWTPTPGSGLLARPMISHIRGDGYQSQILSACGAGRATLELLGNSNGYAVAMWIGHLYLGHLSTASLTAWCLRVGDCKDSFSAERLYCYGANGIKVKVASSLSYAQMCSRFLQCHIATNYGLTFHANDDSAAFKAVDIETGGAYCDNILWESCIFNGVVECRNHVVTFLQCQFYVNPDRPNTYNWNLHAAIGVLTVINCYFEDHVYAIVLDNGVHDMQYAYILGSQFSGVTNYGGAARNKAAILCQNYNLINGNEFGPVTVQSCSFNSGDPAAGNGYEDWEIDAVGVPLIQEGNVNLYDPTVPIRVDNSFGRGRSWEHTTGVESSSKFKSTSNDSYAAGSVVAGVESKDIHASGKIYSDLQVLSPQYYSSRASSGSGSGATWGYAVEKAGGGDNVLLGWSSTNYQPVGAIEWVGNNMPFLYLSDASEFRLGFGTNLGSYYGFSVATFDIPGDLDASGGGASFGENVTIGGSVSISGVATFNQNAKVERTAGGTNDGSFWGYYLSNAAGGDSVILGYSSQAYQPTGTIEWLGNNEAFLYVSSAPKFSIGFGLSAGQSYQFTSTNFTIPSSLTVPGSASIGATATIQGNTFMNGNASVAGTFATTLTSTFGQLATFNSNTRVERTSTGNISGSLWGSYFRNPAGTADMIMGWSSSTYQSAGLVEWLGNSQAFIYLPEYTNVFRLGFSQAEQAYYEFSSTATRLLGTVTSIGGSYSANVVDLTKVGNIPTWVEFTLNDVSWTGAWRRVSLAADTGLVTHASHGYTTGTIVTLIGEASPNAYNGSYTITVSGSDAYTLNSFTPGAAETVPMLAKISSMSPVNTILTLPAGYMIHEVVSHVSTTFSGPTEQFIDIGISSDPRILCQTLNLSEANAIKQATTKNWIYSYTGPAAVDARLIINAGDPMPTGGTVKVRALISNTVPPV